MFFLKKVAKFRCFFGLILSFLSCKNETGVNLNDGRSKNSDPLSSSLDPPADQMGEVAPDTYKVKLKTSKGEFVISVHRRWAPLGADRFYFLVGHHFYDNNRFFATVPQFMTQFGIHGDPRVTEKWRFAAIKDDPVQRSNKRGYVSFAKTKLAHSRNTQVFINTKDNIYLDSFGFSPFGEVISGMDVVDSFSGYAAAPDPEKVQRLGNRYLDETFSQLDHIETAEIF